MQAVAGAVFIRAARAFVLALAVGSAVLSSAAAAPRKGVVKDLTLQNAILYPLESDLLQPDADLSERAVVTRDTVQDSQLTLPSLWWAEQQYGGKLLEEWLAYSGEDGEPRRVDLVVDRQLWVLSSYVEQYQFVHRFGVAALQFGYSTRIFTAQGALLGTYLCDIPHESGVNGDAVSADVADANPPDRDIQLDIAPLTCEVYLDAVGIQAPRGPFGL